jgi:hypothetical protein
MQNEILIPVIRTALYNPHFSSFDVPIGAFHERKPDGKFHPSTHPLWTERQLFYYLTSSLESQPLDDLGAMAVTAGNFWHSFIQTLGLDAGFLKVSDPNAKHAHDKAELFVQDKVLGSQGFLDGVLNEEVLSIDGPRGFEYKSMNSRKLGTCPKGSPTDPEKINWLVAKCPVYYAQAQEYLRMTGFPFQQMLFMALEYPYEMIEICVPYNYSFAQSIADKYHRVRQAVADGELPDACCSIKSKESKECLARLVCPVGRVSV